MPEQRLDALKIPEDSVLQPESRTRDSETTVPVFCIRDSAYTAGEDGGRGCLEVSDRKAKAENIYKASVESGFVRIFQGCLFIIHSNMDILIKK